jgi:hypothetical protein
MGGPGSGRRKLISDEEAKARGTFRAHNSEAASLAKAAERVIAGPWLSEIPEPTLPLGDVGRKEYDRLARSLFEQNKLTIVTQARAEQAALLLQTQFERLSAGKSVPAASVKQRDNLLRDLNIAEKAQPIASPGNKPKKFGRVGFSTRLSAPE